MKNRQWRIKLRPIGRSPLFQDFAWTEGEAVKPADSDARSSSYMQLFFRRARMEGFIALDYVPEFAWARDRLTQWLREGNLMHREDLAHGPENAPAMLMRLFKGDNMGKLAMKVR